MGGARSYAKSGVRGGGVVRLGGGESVGREGVGASSHVALYQWTSNLSALRQREHYHNLMVYESCPLRAVINQDAESRSKSIYRLITEQ